MEGFEALRALPTAALVAIGAMVVVQLVLDVIAFVDLYRRPVEQVATGKKWVWVLVILGVSTIGAILYLVIGRQPAPAVDGPATGSPTQPYSDAADLLYGKDVDPR
jgi:hypothetical protein